MHITLDSLTIQNFKGIKDLSINLLGGDACIYGANATGKTTIYDAFLWLLFDKDSTNRKDFAIKPHDAEGREIHYLETSVEAILRADGRGVQLRRTYSEKWTKKRGEAERIFSGHESLYWIDEVPKTKGEYAAFIGGLIDEDTFRLITSPSYFNSALSWQKRREKLFDMAGALTDEEIIALNPDFAGMDLGGHTVDDARKVAKSTLKKLNDELEKVPVRIDELTRTMPQSEDYGALEARAEGLRQEIRDVDGQLADARKVDKARNAKYAQHGALERKRMDRESALAVEAGKVRGEVLKKLSDLEGYIRIFESKNGVLANEKAFYTQAAAGYEASMAMLRKSWEGVYERQYAPLDLGSDICPTCGQQFPADYLSEKAAAAKEAFERQKQAELNDIQARGVKLKWQKEDAEETAAGKATEIKKNEAEIAAFKVEIEALAPKAQAPVETPDYTADAEWMSISAEMQFLDAELLKDNNDDGTALTIKRAELQAALDEVNRKLALRDVASDVTRRIDALKSEEKNLSQQVAGQEKLLHQLEQFASYKCGLLEQRINDLFPTVRWKLFDVQINGGIADCCECLIGGVPFADANNAARINAGLEIADVIAQHSGVSAPIFVDNAEAVNELRPVGAQMIALLVSSDTALKIENAKEVA